MAVKSDKLSIKDIHIKLDKELFDRLTKLSEIDDRSISSTVKRILVIYIDEYEEALRRVKYIKTED